jgi:hypothetical protein
MLVKFDSKVGSFTMFGDIAVKLLRLMGQSGSIPGAILAKDIPPALQRLRQGVSSEREPAGNTKEDGDEEPNVGLRQRAHPLIELLERAVKSDADVVWEPENRQ